MRLTSKVTQQYHNSTLLVYLSQRFTYRSSQEWQTQIAMGKVFHNEQLGTPKTIVQRNDVVACEVADWQRPFANHNYTILYQDKWMLAINKPPSLRVHGRGRYIKDNLIYQIKYPEHQQHQPFPTAHLVNRLDTDTSGVVLIALDKNTLRHLNNQLATRAIYKTYHAFVHGHPHPLHGTITYPIGKDPHSRIKSKQSIQATGKPARTQYQVQIQFTDYAQLQLILETGRTHQLRIHLATIGHPIIGDALYTMNDDEYMVWAQKSYNQRKQDSFFPRQALHCKTMKFTHPYTKQKQTIIAPYPKDLQELQHKLSELH